MRTRSVLALAAGYPLLGGCVQGPPLEYTAFADGGGALQGDYAGLTKFTLSRSLILLQASQGQSLSVTSVPAEATGNGTDFGVRQLRNGPEAALQVTKIGNSNLVSALTLGSPMGSVPAAEAATAQASASPAAPAKLAAVIDMQALLATARPGALALAGLALGEGRELAFSVALAPVPADAIPTGALDLHRTGRLYFYSACRAATLTFLNPPFARQSFTVTVADPNFVQTVALGPDRTIASHASCGVDVLAGVAPSAVTSSGLARLVEHTRGLSALWATRPMSNEAAALAALKPVEAPRPARRKGRAAVAANRPESSTERPQPPSPPANGPLRNAEIRLPIPKAGESFSF